MTIYFAPMEGLTDGILRQTHNRIFGGIDVYCLPFHKLTQSLSLLTREKRDISPEENEGLNVLPQALTRDPEQLSAWLYYVSECGYPCADLNLGCPSPTVTRRGRGSGLLHDLSSYGLEEPTAQKALAAGADILDIGGCSTRPGSTPASEAEEWRRVEPALKALRKDLPREPRRAFSPPLPPRLRAVPPQTSASPSPGRKWKTALPGTGHSWLQHRFRTPDAQWSEASLRQIRPHVRTRAPQPKAPDRATAQRHRTGSPLPSVSLPDVH